MRRMDPRRASSYGVGARQVAASPIQPVYIGIASLLSVIGRQPAFRTHTNHYVLSAGDGARALGNVGVAGFDAKIPVCQWPRITLEINWLDRCNWPFNADILVGSLFGLHTQAKAAGALEQERFARCLFHPDRE